MSVSFAGCGRFAERFLRQFLRNLAGKVQQLLGWYLQNQCALLVYELVYRDLARWLYLHFDFIL